MSDDYVAFRSILVDRPVVFHPSLARLFGGIHEALFFQQIAFWSGKGDDPDWIYKTREELENETCLSRYQQEQARKKLVKLGVLEETRRGLPAKLFYRIVWPRVYELYGAAGRGGGNEPPRMRETDILAGKDARNSQSRRREPDQHAGEKLTNRGARNSPPNTEKTPEPTQRRRQSNVIPEDGNLELAKIPLPLATPEERLAHFEATQATMRRMRGLG